MSEPSNQKKHFLTKNIFQSLRNPTGGVGRIIPTSLMTQILLEDPGSYPSPEPPSPETPAVTPGWVILTRCKKRAEELFVRLTDNHKPTRPAKAFSHFPSALIKEIIESPYSPSGALVERPVSFTFLLAFSGIEKRYYI